MAPAVESAGRDEPREERGYVLEEQVGHLLRRAHQRATAMFLATIGVGQLTPTQFAALVKLSEKGQLSQNLLGRLTAMDPATTQGVVRRLHERRLIERKPDPKDRRRAVLNLTDEGRRVVATALPNGLRVSEAILEPLDRGEREQFLRLLKRLA